MIVVALRQFRSALLFAALFLASVPGFAVAAPGDIDPSFGFAGRVLDDYQHAAAEILALATQPDGKIVAVGNIHEGTVTGPSRFLVARYNSDGRADSSFGNGGKVVTNFLAGPASANAVALQSDGKIVVAGKAGDLFALARYDSDGTLDQTFDSDGLIAAAFEPNSANTISLASSLALQLDGRIVVGGDSFARNPTAPDYVLNSNIALARYNSDGTLDGTFGMGGFVVSSFGNFDRTDAIAVQPDGKIIVAGDSNATGVGLYDYTVIVVRYTADGAPDETFGVAGKALPVSGSFDVSALALRRDGKIVAAGTYLSPYPANKDFALARYTSDGTLDSDFGIDGLGVTDFAWTGSATGRENVAATLAMQADGKILVGGYSGSSFALARYQEDAAPDTAFGAAGISIARLAIWGRVLSILRLPIPVALSIRFSALRPAMMGRAARQRASSSSCFSLNKPSPSRFKRMEKSSLGVRSTNKLRWFVTITARLPRSPSQLREPELAASGRRTAP